MELIERIVESKQVLGLPVSPGKQNGNGKSITLPIFGKVEGRTFLLALLLAGAMLGPAAGGSMSGP